ncbi:hypothetical protein BaRGS_00038157 [Batillaria attramentaria]|uniref:Uncharacterized protein n=1 Tax=Batillaria attramentaria TaxID=370345 RepID=A0ABD0J732_9CAEN
MSVTDVLRIRLRQYRPPVQTGQLLRHRRLDVHRHFRHHDVRHTFPGTVLRKTHCAVVCMDLDASWQFPRLTTLWRQSQARALAVSVLLRKRHRAAVYTGSVPRYDSCTRTLMAVSRARLEQFQSQTSR